MAIPAIHITALRKNYRGYAAGVVYEGIFVVARYGHNLLNKKTIKYEYYKTVIKAAQRRANGGLRRAECTQTYSTEPKAAVCAAIRRL